MARIVLDNGHTVDVETTLEEIQKKLIDGNSIGAGWLHYNDCSINIFHIVQIREI